MYLVFGMWFPKTVCMHVRAQLEAKMSAQNLGTQCNAGTACRRNIIGKGKDCEDQQDVLYGSWKCRAQGLLLLLHLFVDAWLGIFLLLLLP